jgi:hypothetical protein
MNSQRQCLYCGITFTATRADHYFCCAAHVAAYYRANPNPDYIHAEKQREHWYYCEECGVPFQVNDYAKRAGQRTPKYHSNACKQKAYRARGKATQEQAQRRGNANAGSTGNANAGSTGDKRQSSGNSRQNAGNGGSSGKSSHSGSSANYWAGYKSRWEAARMILNVPDGATAKQLRRAWMDLLKIWHPDINPSPEATAQTQKINWAYEYLSKP